MTDHDLLDTARVRARFNRASDTYDRHALVQQEIGRRLDERFEWLRLTPRRILDLGAGTGQLTVAMRRRFPRAQVVSLDLAEALLARVPKQGRIWRRRAVVCADMHQLPFAAGSFDVVVSNFAVQWSQDLPRLFAEVARVLAAGGAFLFTTLGPQTLRECRLAWRSVDHAAHINQFTDLHEVGDALVSACFADPVIDQEQLTAHYSSADALLAELRAVGVGNSLTTRPRGLTGRKAWQAFMAALSAQAEPQGVPLTYEVIYGLGWGAGISPLLGSAPLRVESVSNDTKDRHLP
ncbi:malonyl-ACP O-methyltransferase BioC [Halothiobacillus sp. DCM-1]|uniref:malonyl-ACP O-methyltransferase BioC n=1 Tax=Halothiobacillus sp. DCM-1 TaxID=3112558 RepID=UPI0032434661